MPRNRYFTAVGYGDQLSGPPGQPGHSFKRLQPSIYDRNLDSFTDTLLFLNGNLNEPHMAVEASALVVPAAHFFWAMSS